MKLKEALSPFLAKPFIAEATDKNRRIVIENFSPSIDDGKFLPKFIVDELVAITADIYTDSHDQLAAQVLWREKSSKDWNMLPMQSASNNSWFSQLAFNHIGLFELKIEAWVDQFGSYKNALRKKVEARIDVSVELEEGLQLIKKTLSKIPQRQKKVEFQRLMSHLNQYENATNSHDLEAGGLDKDLSDSYNENEISALNLFFSDEIEVLYQSICQKEFVAASPIYPLRIDRTQAEFSSWYEMFPRSQSGDVNRHGTFGDVMSRLPGISEMGFDTLYFTPIHPIGKKFRKGKNNSLIVNEDDPGSPYAIGSAEGGHDALHAEIGSWQDFRTMREAANNLNIEIAIDFAIQCSPDHPWISQHPDWFKWRPDGTIQYAENPPKKYQDIVNVDFYAENAIPELWISLKDIVLFWAQEGVRTFRVDNPHTKPFPFWEWLISEVQIAYPDTIFLAEAFTYPKIMARLAKVGFTQSYTYFTWRNTKQELTEYLTELTHTADYYRPHFFANTPDINPFYLQQNGRNGFLVRAVLAATTSGLWGISSGFELCEADAVEGKEEFKNSEKYEIRAWDWDRPGNIIHEISILNKLRKTYKQLQTLKGIEFHPSDNDQVIFYSKKGRVNPADKVDSLILVVVNLSANSLQDSTLDIPLYLLGLDDQAVFEVHDLVSDTHFTLQGMWQQIRLDPEQFVFVIWKIKAAEDGRTQ